MKIEQIIWHNVSPKEKTDIGSFTIIEKRCLKLELERSFFETLNLIKTDESKNT